MKYLGWIALVLLASIPYAGALRAPLLYDDRTILDTPWVAHEAGPVSVFTQGYWHGVKHAPEDLYRPLTVLSLAWNLRLSPSREGIHGVNVAAHALAALAVFWMLLAIARAEAAWIGAALFAVHPLASEAVLCAVGRAEIFAALFGLCAFVLYVRLGGGERTGGRRLALSAGAFFVALCFKESAASWLAIGALWTIVLPEDGRPPEKILLARAAAYVAALAAFLALRGAAVGWTHAPAPFVDNPLVAVDGATRAANALFLFFRYVAKMLWPASLSLDYGFDQVSVVPLFPWGAVAAVAIAIGLACVCVVLRRKGLAAAAFLAAFVPAAFAVTGNLVFPIGTIFGERLAYTPLIGFCGLAGVLLAGIPTASWRRIAVAVLLVACAARTTARGGDYRDLATLNEATAAASPRAVKALVNAGRTRLRTGNAAGARPLFERAVAIWPDYAKGWRLLADSCDAVGDAAAAEEARRRARTAVALASPADEPL
jgi:protein O-mannosyl-transferase